jgi:hypothetical protein
MEICTYQDIQEVLGLHIKKIEIDRLQKISYVILKRMYRPSHHANANTNKKKKRTVSFKDPTTQSQHIKPDWHVIGEYRISNTCIHDASNDTDSPCLHYVYLKDSEVVYVLNGKDIYKLLNRSKLSHHHFEKYKEIIDINPLSFLCCGLY